MNLTVVRDLGGIYMLTKLTYILFHFTQDNQDIHTSQSQMSAADTLPRYSSREACADANVLRPLMISSYCAIFQL